MNYMEIYNQWLESDYFDANTKKELENIKGNEKEIEELLGALQRSRPLGQDRHGSNCAVGHRGHLRAAAGSLQPHKSGCGTQLHSALVQRRRVQRPPAGHR